MVKHNKRIEDYLTPGKRVHLVGIGGVSMRQNGSGGPGIGASRASGAGIPVP